MFESVRLRGTGPVLMTDDSESDAFLARACYERSSLKNEFRWLATGEELLGHLDQVKTATEPMPALVLLDINMPGLDGFEVLHVIRATPEFREVPIVTMFTNSDDPNDVERAHTLGADGFFTKPSDIRDYVAFFDSLAAE